MRITFAFADHPCPWGGRQARFEHLTTDGPDRFFLVGRDADEEQIRASSPRPRSRLTQRTGPCATLREGVPLNIIERQVATRNAIDVQIVDGRLRLYLIADDNESDLLVYEPR